MSDLAIDALEYVVVFILIMLTGVAAALLLSLVFEFVSTWVFRG